MKVLHTFVAVAISVFLFLSCTTSNNPDYTLTTSTEPLASGIVTPSQGSFTDGSDVEISADANENMVFSGWRGDLTGSDNPAVITMNSNKNIIAFFVDRQNPLSIHIEGEGAVTERVLQEKSAKFAHGTFVELTARPAEGWRLVEWRGDLSGSQNPAVIKMDQPRDVTVVFEKRQYPLAISIEGEGHVAEQVMNEKSTDYEYGAHVELTAHPADGWVFSGWGGDLQGTENPATIHIEQQAGVTAFFQPVDEIFAFTVQGEGTVDIEQINSDENPSKNWVQLTARPYDGWKFTEWRGDITGAENPVQIILNKETAVEARFDITEYPLTIHTEGEGTVTEQVVQTRTTDYEQGTVVELSANPAEGWEFIEWKGDLSGSDNPKQITVDSPKEVTAVFAEVPEEDEPADDPAKVTYTLAVNLQGQGSVNIDPEQEEYESGALVKLTASAADGWQFVEWTGDIRSSQTSVEVTMDSDKEITAVFKIREYPLTIHTEGEGTVTENVVQPRTTDYEQGTVVELSANPAEGWEFIEWKGDLTGSDNPKRITVDGPKEVTAVFAEVPEEDEPADDPAKVTYTLAVNLQGQGSVSIDPEQEEYESGTKVELTASPSNGWEFVQWTGDMSSTQPSIEVTMDSDKDVTAIFAEVAEEITYTLAINIQGEGSVTIDPEQEEYESGALVKLTASAADGWQFVEWTGDMSSTQPSIEVTMDSDKEITALFIEQETAFSGGDGSTGNPYQVSTVEQLQTISEFIGSNFIQINNINAASTTGWNGGEGFRPIGNSSNPFTGTFNGNGFEISGLTIDRDGDDHVGLFSFIGSAQINNARLVNVNIIGEDMVGGLAGTNNGQISNSYVTGSVSGDEIVGGLVAINNGKITSSQSVATVFGDDDYIGGLAGINNGEISKSYAIGSVTGDELVGGLVGVNRNNAQIINSYATGTVSGGDEVGGLAGRNWPNGVIATSYASGSVSGDDDTGGFIGWNQASLDSCYWDNQATNQNNGIGRGSQNGLTGLTTSDMTGSSAEENMSGFDWSEIWKTVPNDYPTLQ